MGTGIIMATVKNCYSPGGTRVISYGTGYAHLRDCPNCKFGTLDTHRSGMKCADCNQEFTPKQLRILGVFSSN